MLEGICSAVTLTGFAQIENFACALHLSDQQRNEKGTARGYLEVNGAWVAKSDEGHPAAVPSVTS